MRYSVFIFFLLLVVVSRAQPLTDSDIPIVILTTNSSIPDEPKVQGHFTLLYNGPNVRNYLTDAPAFESEIGIELHGTYSQTFPQQSYGFELRDSTGATYNASLLGMPPEHDWLLISTYNDKAFSRNTLASDLFQKMGNYAPRFRFCEVIWNNDYRGIYMLGESIKRDHNRVNIAKLDSTDITYPNVTGGYIIKNDYWSFSDSWQSNFGPVDHPSYDVHLVYHYPPPQNIQPAQETYIQSFINQFETSLYSPNFADPLNGYRQYADDLSFVDYFIINELSRNYDGFMHSFYFNKDIDGNSPARLRCGPVWDFDWAFNNITVSTCTDFAASDGSGWAYLINDCPPHSVNSVGWHVRMLQDTAFQNLLRCRWEQLRQTILDTTYLFHHIDSVAAYLNEAQARHYARWGHLSTNVGSCHVPPIPSTFAGHVAQLKTWLAIRIAWLDGNMPGSSANCTLGVHDPVSPGMTAVLFPNPAGENAFLETSGFDDGLHLTCYDQRGRVVMEQPLENKGTIALRVSALSDGIYILQLKDRSGKQLYRKLVVSH